MILTSQKDTEGILVSDIERSPLTTMDVKSMHIGTLFKEL
jgi:hypothetical protein